MGEYGDKARDIAAKVKAKPKAKDAGVHELADLVVMLADKVDWLNDAAVAVAGEDWEPPET